MSRPAPALLLLALLAAAGCQQDQPASASPPRAATPPRPVRVVPAAEAVVPRGIVATGTLAADEQVLLGAKVPGRLAEIAVDLGSRVRRGQAIGRIDPNDYQHRLAQAEAALQQARARLGLPATGTSDRIDPEATSVVRQARATLEDARLTRERTQRLWEQQLVARAQLDSAIAALQVAEGRYQDALEEVRNRQGVLVQRRAEVDLARQQLADTVLRSPIDGAVSQRHASVGEFLGEGAQVATIIRLHPLRLRLSLPEREAGSVRVGQRVAVTVEGDVTTHQGAVVRLAPAIAEQSRTLLVEAEVPNERGLLRAGAFARGEVIVEADRRIITVPASAIVVFAGVEKVLVVQDGKAVEIRVQTGRRAGDRVEVVSGLRPGQLVVVEPGNLAGGQPVAVAP